MDYRAKLDKSTPIGYYKFVICISFTSVLIIARKKWMVKETMDKFNLLKSEFSDGRY
jgi:hypothetical protein